MKSASRSSIVRKFGAGFLAMSAAAALAACSSEDDSTATKTSDKPESSQESSAVAPKQPTVEELNEILAKASDPNVPTEEKVNTVQGGETAPELFDTMTQSKVESGAEFEVVDPVLPGMSPNSVLAAVQFSTPDQPDQNADNVEFIYEDGVWKLSQSWACTLITNTVTPDQVPEMCHGQGGGSAPAGEENGEGEPAPAPAPEEGEPAPEDAPAPEEAPAPAPEGAPAPEEAPAPAPEGEPAPEEVPAP